MVIKHTQKLINSSFFFAFSRVLFPEVWESEGGSVRVWRYRPTLKILVVGDWRQLSGGYFLFFPSEIRVTRRQWRPSTYLPYTTGGIHSQNKHDRHTDSRFGQLEDNSPKDVRGTKTKGTHHERVEKPWHSCQIELRGAHLKLVYYNGKQVLVCIQHTTCHFTVLLVRNKDEHTDTCTYMLR